MTDHEHAFMNQRFDFAPGDAVIEKRVASAVIADIRVRGKRDRYGSAGLPMGVTIVERVLKQCHGGLQGFYQVHERDRDGHAIVTMHPSHAMMAYEAFVEATIEVQSKAPEQWGKWADTLGLLGRAIVDHEK